MAKMVYTFDWGEKEAKSGMTPEEKAQLNKATEDITANQEWINEAGGQIAKINADLVKAQTQITELEKHGLYCPKGYVIPFNTEDELIDFVADIPDGVWDYVEGSLTQVYFKKAYYWTPATVAVKE